METHPSPGGCPDDQTGTEVNGWSPPNSRLRMTERLFVYGTLAPGRPNEHVLAALPGKWEPASVRGRLLPEGWGAAAGYPGIVLDDEGSEIEGLLFSSDCLGEHWDRVDEFEGEGYERVVTTVKLKDGGSSDGYIYRLRGNGPPERG